MKETEKLNQYVMDDYKYYGRRVEIVSLTICGFGLYANLELFQLLNSNLLFNQILLLVSVLSFIAGIIFNLNNIIHQREISGYYMQLLHDSFSLKDKKKAYSESKSKEKKVINYTKYSFWLIVIGMLLPLACIMITFFYNY